jgi:TetR/AcrR family transcriptional repressor of nem operon
MSTAEEIVTVAQEMIQKRGFHAFSYRDISERVGIKTASIHYYFPSKGDLAGAIVARVSDGFAAALAEIDAATTDPGERLRRFCGLFLSTYAEGDRLCPICMLAMGQETVPEPVRAGVREFWLRGEEWVAEVLGAGVEAGCFNLKAPAQIGGRTFMAALEGAMVAARAFVDRERLTGVIDYLLATVIAEPCSKVALNNDRTA